MLMGICKVDKPIDNYVGILDYFSNAENPDLGIALFFSKRAIHRKQK